MKLQDQVCSLELSKKLKELGVKQESLFYWSNCYKDYMYEDLEMPHIERNYGEPFRVTRDRIIQSIDKEYDKLKIEEVIQYSAFTVAEMGEMLPENITAPGVHFSGDSIINTFWLSFDLENGLWYCYYYNGEENINYTKVSGCETEADARAKMLIYLIENGLKGE